jgi:hypothetical protein
VFDLVAGHAAALLGDVSSARPRLERAMKKKAGARLVAAQARASLALALALSWKQPDAKVEDEIARAMFSLPSNGEFTREPTVTQVVRGALAAAYQKRGACIEATLFGSAQCPLKWDDPGTVQTVIDRVSSPATAFDRFMVAGSGFTLRTLERGLALLRLKRGELDEAQRILRSRDVESTLLGTDPFVIHIRDCHDCDHQVLGPGSKWTHSSLVARIVDLERRARATGEEGAAAAFALGNAYYNVTTLGNARSFAEGTPVSFDVARAESWYRRAFDESKNRELRAKASFMAAKCELGRITSTEVCGEVNPADGQPYPKEWFAVLRGYSDTAYYREVLKECGHFRRWTAAFPQK